LQNSCKADTTKLEEFSVYRMADENSCPRSFPSVTDMQSSTELLNFCKDEVVDLN